MNILSNPMRHTPSHILIQSANEHSLESLCATLHPIPDISGRYMIIFKFHIPKLPKCSKKPYRTSGLTGEDWRRYDRILQHKLSNSSEATEVLDELNPPTHRAKSHDSISTLRKFINHSIDDSLSDIYRVQTVKTH